MFSAYLDLWGLTPDGGPIVTHAGQLLPVRREGQPAMLKISVAAEERRGAALMTWWDGEGAARVLARASEAMLLERAPCEVSLAEMARGGGDDEASRILCAAIGRLRPDRPPPAGLIPLDRWFRDLEPAAAAQGGILATSAAATRALLAEPRETGVLHGDIHHGNVLDFGPRGWLAIDPKGLIGERGFDHANLFCNPDAETCLAPGRLARQIGVVAEAAELEPQRLVRWVLAWAGLSATWSVADGHSPAEALAVAEIAAGMIS